MIQSATPPRERDAVVFIIFLGMLHALGAWSNDLFVPSLPLAADSLAAGYGDIQLTMTAVLLGFAAGQLLYGPLSDRFGRRSMLCVGLAVYTLGSYFCATADSLVELIAARSLQGLGGAAGMVLARAIILDRWVGEEASRMLSAVVLVAFLTPAIAPMIGGYLATLGHWPLVFWAHTFLGATFLLGALTLLSRVRGPQASVSIASRFLAYGDVLRDREALLFMACIGVSHAGVMAFVTNSAFVFVTHLGLSPFEYSFCFSAVMLGGVTGSLLNRRLVTRLGIPRLLSLGTAVVAAAGAAALALNTVSGGLLSTLIPSICYTFGMALILSNAVAQVLSRFRHMAGAAAAVVGVGQFLFSALAAAILSLYETPSALPLSVALAVCGAGTAAVWWGWLRRTSSASGLILIETKGRT